MRVLVCEDETIIRLDLCQLLESAGLTVVGEARDGEEAVRLAAELQPDIILMDVRMPELDGVEAARRILAERQVPIVMVTAFAERDIVQQASEAGRLRLPREAVPARRRARRDHDRAGAQQRAGGGARGGEAR